MVQLPSWAGAKRVCIDIETHDPKLKDLGPGVRRGAYICGIGFKIEDGPEHYMPIRHAEDNLPAEHVWAYMKDQSNAFKGTIVGANLQYDLDFLWEKGILFPNIDRYLDIQIAEPLLDELQESYSLEAICARYGIPGKDKRLLIDAAQGYGCRTPEETMRYLPARFIAPYALQDVRLPLIISRRQERMLEEQELNPIHDLESKLLPALLRMRRRGVRVDTAHLQKVEDWTHIQQGLVLDQVFAETGIQMSVDDLNNPVVLARVLVAIGVNKDDIPTTPKTKKPSINKELLEKIKLPVAQALARGRRIGKLRTTFVQSVRDHMCNGRIHTTFNQMRKSSDDEEDPDDQGGRYGRLSSCDPNLQQQPARDPEIGPFWRKIYIPEEGCQWAALDYSQQEPRVLIHFAEITKCDRAWEAAERYRTDPKTDNHTMTAQLIAGKGPDWVPTKKQRSESKEIFLGLGYGMGGAKLARKVGLPTEWKWNERAGKMIEVAGPEAQALFNVFHAGVPFVRQLSDKCQKRVKEMGFIRTILGRKCRFPVKPEEFRKNPQDIYDWLHKALNRLVQGSSADQTKLAVVQIDAAGYFMQLQVHDEIDGSVRDENEAEGMAHIMRTCVPLRVPSKVDVELGDSWGGSM